MRGQVMRNNTSRIGKRLYAWEREAAIEECPGRCKTSMWFEKCRGRGRILVRVCGVVLHRGERSEEGTALTDNFFHW